MAQGFRIRTHDMYKPFCLLIKTKDDKEHKDGNIVLFQHTEAVWSLNIKCTIVEDRVDVYKIIFSFYVARNYGASEAVNLCRYVEKSAKCPELKCANSLRE